MQTKANQIRLRDFPKLIRAHNQASIRKKLMSDPDLTYLFWESTLKCNLHCTHCGSNCGGSSKLNELSTEEIKSTFKTIIEDFETKRIFVTITGGEPLLRHDLFDVVDFLGKKHMRSSMVSNGVLLNKEKAERLVAGHMVSATISIDGLEHEHEAVRGKDTYRRTMNALQIARDADFRVVEAITCVRPDNLDQLETIEKEVREAGANAWRLITIDKMGRGDDAPGLWLDPPQIRHLLDFVADRRAHYLSARDFSVRFSCGGFLGVESEDGVRPEYGQCYAGLCVGSILADGDVSACPSLPRHWAQGNIRNRRFSDIWFNEFKDYRDLSWRKTGVCSDCSFFDTCLGGGLHERLVQPHDFCWIDRQL